jgi:hypothetical protein
MPGPLADSDILDKWGSEFGIPRLTGEIDSYYANRMAGIFQQPPAGGTAQDYYNWAIAATAGGIPANIAETIVPAQVITGAQSYIILNGISNPNGWVNGDPVTFTTTGTLPSPLVVGTTYYTITGNPPEPATIDVALSASVGGPAIVFTSQGTGLHNISHAPQPNDPNNFWVTNATVTTPNSLPVPTQPGNVAITIVPDDETILNPSSIYYVAGPTLVTVTNNYINTRSPVTVNSNIVSLESIESLTISITVSPVTVNVTTIINDILNYVNYLQPGQVMYLSQINAIALRDGAVNSFVTSPGTDIIPATTSTAIRATGVDVTLSS